VAQIEELGFDNFRQRKAAVAGAEDYRQENGYFFSALLVTDVVEQTSLLLLAANREFQEVIDYPEVEEVYEIGRDRLTEEAVAAAVPDPPTRPAAGRRVVLTSSGWAGLERPDPESGQQ
jgi:hypothetical protein